jgi:hypothetical protein
VNRWGHDRRNPRLELARHTPEGMPREIYLLKQTATEIASCSRGEFRRRFPELQFVDRTRTRYSPRREALALMLGAIAIHVDLRTQRVRHAVEDLAKEAGLRLQRAWRAVDDLRRARWLVSRKQRKEEILPRRSSGRRFKSHPVARQLEGLMFRRLGINLDMEIAQKRREQDHTRELAQARTDREAQQRAELAHLPHIRSAPPAPAPTLTATEEATAVNDARRKVAEQLERWRASQPPAGGTDPPE